MSAAIKEPDDDAIRSLAARIEFMWLELATCPGRREIWVTRSGRVIRPVDVDRHRYADLVGTYDRNVTLQQLRDDVFFVWEAMNR